MWISRAVDLVNGACCVLLVGSLDERVDGWCLGVDGLKGEFGKIVVSGLLSVDV